MEKTPTWSGILLGLWLIAPPPATTARALAISHVTVVDATGRPPQPDMTVVVTDGRISAVGRASKIEIPKDAQVVPADGKFLIPGLWNMHLHAGSYEEARKALPALLAKGITGVRDMGAPLDDVLRLRHETGSRILLGPRLVVSGPLLQGPLPFQTPLLLSVNNKVEARQTVSRLKARGVDFVKVQDTLPRDLYLAIANQAKREHLPLAGHIPPSVLAAEVADVGQVSVEHLGGQFLGILLGCSRREGALHAEQVATMQALRQALEKGQPPTKMHLRAAFARAVLDSYDDKKAASLFARFVRRGTWQCPTLVTLRTLWEGQKEGLSEEDLAYGARVYAKDLEVVRSMHRAGVRFLAGTDGPYTSDPSALHDELALLVEAG